MKNAIYLLSFLLLAFLGLSSFGSVPNTAADDNRIQSKENRLQKAVAKRQERLDIRRERLTYRMEQSDNKVQKMRLQRRLDRIDRLKEGGNPVFGIIATISGGIAVVGLLLFLLGAFRSLWGLAGVGFYIASILGLIAIAMGIVGIILSKKKSDKFGGFRSALAGIILGIAAILLFVVFIAITIVVLGGISI